jgi:hypothetical protein
MTWALMPRIARRGSNLPSGALRTLWADVSVINSYVTAFVATDGTPVPTELRASTTKV